MAPRSIFHHISFDLLFCNLYFPIYTTKIPKIFTLLSLSDLTFASDREGIDNPFIVLVSRFLIVCLGTRWLVRCLLLDSYLGSQNWGKYLRYFAALPLPLQGKTNASSRGSKKDFWRHCWGYLHQVKPYQVPITNSYPSHYIICHLPLVFLSPTSSLPFYSPSLFCSPLFRLLLVCLCVGLLARHDDSR